MPTSRVKTNLFLTFEIATKCVLRTTILSADSLNQPTNSFSYPGADPGFDQWGGPRS